ncbi:triacylglycerol lipase [Vibrio sp. FNV 38]|nr:triacylglycerol lipase [Vibrio sp. FNV 38]
MNIVILHGLYMHSIVMQPLASSLEKLEFTTKLITYNTLSIDAERVFSLIDQALDLQQRNILVGHSLGGLIIQRYLENRNIDTQTVSHVVTIGSPLQGASIVSVIEELGLGILLGNATEHGLAAQDNKWVVPQCLGSIAGNFDFGARRLLVGELEESDGTVTVEETQIEGMADHIVTKLSHTALIYSAFVPKQIEHFVKNSKFDHAS